MNDTRNHAFDQSNYGTKQSSSTAGGVGKVIWSADGTPIKMHLDLSSII